MQACQAQPLAGGMVGVKAHAVVADLDGGVRGGGPGAHGQLGGLCVLEGIGPHLCQHGPDFAGGGWGQRQVGQVVGHVPLQGNAVEIPQCQTTCRSPRNCGQPTKERHP